jgi:cobalt/nickel transport system permease protein
MSSATLPEWLQQTKPVGLPEARNRGFGKDYLEKTLHHINRVLMEDASSVAISDVQGILQGIATPIKLIGILALIIAAALTQSIVVLVALNSIIFGTAIQSGIGCKAFGIRVWLPTALFAGISVLPGIINWITPGEALYTFYTGVSLQFGYFTLPADLAITKQGVQAASFVVLRAAASLGLATLFIKTTRWSLVTKALAKFGLPQEIVMVFDLTYRYIYLFLRLFTEYLLGRRSRLVGVESESAKISWIGGTIAAFLQLTWGYSQEINYAMQSRGYCGDYDSQAPVSLRSIDYLFLFVVAVLCCCALWRNFS